MNELHVRQLSVAYRSGTPVLHGISFKLHAGQVLLIHGHNGSGKSTLLRAISGLLPISESHVSWNGTPVSKTSFGAAVHSWIGFLPQSGNVFPNLTVSENLELAIHRDRSTAPDDLIERVAALRPLAQKRAGLLSGGERKLLAFAMATAIDTPVLLLDEPVAGLSSENSSCILNILRQRRERGTIVIVVEHSPEALGQELVDIRAEMRDGAMTSEVLAT